MTHQAVAFCESIKRRYPTHGGFLSPQGGVISRSARMGKPATEGSPFRETYWLRVSCLWCPQCPLCPACINRIAPNLHPEEERRLKNIWFLIYFYDNLAYSQFNELIKTGGRESKPHDRKPSSSLIYQIVSIILEEIFDHFKNA
jgi:hypothetical protein